VSDPGATRAVLAIEPLTKGAFAPFGDVIESAGAKPISINQGTTERFHALSRMQASGDGSGVIVSIFEAVRRGSPIEIRMLEHHPLGSQTFMPISGHNWLVVVAPPLGGGKRDNQDQGDGLPDFNGLRCFEASERQGVTYAPGVWHHPLLVLRDHDQFLVVDREAPKGERPDANLTECWFENQVAVIER